MESILIGFCIVIDIYELIDFLKPFLKRKYFNDGYKLKLVSPLGEYITLGLALLGAVYFLFLFITQKEIINIIFFSLLFYIGMTQLSKSFVLFCKGGLFLNGIYFSNDEKQEGQIVTEIICSRRIYAIKTTNKYAYVFLSSKYINQIL